MNIYIYIYYVTFSKLFLKHVIDNMKNMLIIL